MQNTKKTMSVMATVMGWRREAIFFGSQTNLGALTINNETVGHIT